MARPFNDTVNNTGLIQLCEQTVFGDSGFGQISGDNARLQIFTNYINEAASRYTNIVTKSDGRWQFDDENYSDYPIATRDLVANQQDYPFLTTMLEILSVEISNAAGVWYTIGEVDEAEMANWHVSMTQRFKVPSQPWKFSRMANSIFLLPATNYNYTGGFKVKYQRPPSYFVWTDTTKNPGWGDTLHDYLANYAAWKYLLTRNPSQASVLKGLVDQAEQTEIPDFYLKREKDTTKSLYPKFVRRR